MHEGPPPPEPTPEEVTTTQPSLENVTRLLTPEEIEREEEAQYQQYLADHPEPAPSKEGPRECGPEIATFEDMLISFEATHSLEELHAIVDLRPEDAANYPLRQSAKAALIPIVALLNIMEKETNISVAQHQELKEKYKRLSRAVGIINKNKVDHER